MKSLVAALAIATTTQPLAAQERPYWPTAAWHAAPSNAVDPVALAKFYEYAFTRRGPDADKQGIRTDGVVAIKGGELAFERYYGEGGFKAETPHISWSVSKSFINALIGIAVQENKLSLDDKLSQYLPVLASGDARSVTVKQALEMSSCVDWEETYEGAGLTKSSVLAMLYGKGRYDMAGFVAAKGVRCEPGTRWSYSSGTSLVLSALLKQIYGASYDAMPWAALFDRIGVKSVIWERDQAGTFVGSSYLYATPRDLAKLGFLFLNDGVWNGQRLLPEGWARYSGNPAAALYTTDVPTDGSSWVGGAHWWSNAPVPEKGLGSTWPAAPSDMYVASGHWGQSIYVIPSLDVVIVRTGDDRDGTLDENHFLELALAALQVGGAKETKMPQFRAKAAVAEGNETPYVDIPGLSSAFVAKELCSCLFVMGRSEEQCTVYASQSPQLASPTIDWEAKTVRAALRLGSIRGRGLYARAARYLGQRYGCVFE